MPAGYCFRVLAFQKSGNDYLFQSVADYASDGSSTPVLQRGEMLLSVGQTYRFVAYSFNNDTALGALPTSCDWNSTSVPIPDLNNDFLTYDSGDKLVPDDAFTLPVSFTQRLCRLTVKISVTGFPSNTFSNCTGVYVKEGGSSSSWTVGSDAVSANTNNSATFSISDNSTASVRLVPFASARPITVHFGTLTVGGIAANNTDITSSQSVQLQPGRSYTMTVQLKNGIGIQVPEGDINLTGNGCTAQDKTDLSILRWAEGNLKSTDNSKPYVWTTSTDYGYYYTWMSTYTGNTSTNNTDPCSKLDAATYGSGWRTPSKNEFEKLSRCTDKQLVSNNDTNGMWFMNKTKGLFLPAAGSRHYTNGSGTLPTDYLDTFGYYWSSDVSSGSFSYYLLFNSGNAYIYDYSKALGISVRCVKRNQTVSGANASVHLIIILAL